MGYSFRLAARVLLYVPSHRQDSTYHSLCYPVVEHWLELEITQWDHHEGSIQRSIVPWANALTMELHLAPVWNKARLLLNVIVSDLQFWAVLLLQLTCSTCAGPTWTWVGRPSGCTCYRSAGPGRPPYLLSPPPCSQCRLLPWSPTTIVIRKEMFYLTTHSTLFIYSYMASDIWLRTILIVRKETRCRHMGCSFWLTARVLLYAPSHRQDSTYHSFCYTICGALAGTKNSSMGSPHEGSIWRSIAPWVNALTTELHLAPIVIKTHI